MLRVIERDPHEAGGASANWTTGVLAPTWRATGTTVDQETVQLYLLARDYVCKRPAWTLNSKAAAQEGYVGNARGWSGRDSC